MALISFNYCPTAGLILRSQGEGRLAFFLGSRQPKRDSSLAVTPAIEAQMKHFKAIAAMSLNRVIGRDNRIPWHLPEDFKWFKRLTAGQIVVMGRRTFESIGRLLPNRTTIVVTRTQPVIPGVRTVSDLGQIDPGAETAEVFICGGAQLYAQALPLCSNLYLTLVKRVVEGDTYFPPFEETFELAEVVQDNPEFRISHYRHRQLDLP